MERNSNGMISNINDIIETFCKYGFELKVESFPDISFTIQQKFRGVKDISHRDNTAFKFTWSDTQKTFIIFENYSVYHKGVSYEEEGRKFYFFSIQNYISEIYHDDEMYQLYQDCSKEIRKCFSKEELREISLNLLGV